MKKLSFKGSIPIKIIKMDGLTLEEKIVDVSTLYKLENLLRIFRLLRILLTILNGKIICRGSLLAAKDLIIK
jgi:hypothetical protein